MWQVVSAIILLQGDCVPASGEAHASPVAFADEVRTVTRLAGARRCRGGDRRHWRLDRYNGSGTALTNEVLDEAASHIRRHQEHEHPRRTGRPPGQTDRGLRRPVYPYRRVRAPAGQ